MKKALSVLVVFIMSSVAFAQSPVIRLGNHYELDGMDMNKKEFNNYLKDNYVPAYSMFNNGLKLSNVGWGLFGGGLAGSFISGALEEAAYYQYRENGNGRNYLALARSGAYIGMLGGFALLSGVICVSVGYGRMHRAADIYNISYASRPTAELKLQTTQDGVGLAVVF